ncbi:MAG: MBL fold metallo-hydrolase [Sedimentisphaerales bacterium]|nr:MBL fold metallo-hydrolase [Sedimentisphaerales bacterium]
MKTDCFVLGEYQTNCYLVCAGQDTSDCLIIDPGFDCEPLVDYLIEKKLNPVAIILTHGHIDHIAGVNILRESFPDVKVYIHTLDAEMLEEPLSNLSLMTGAAFTTAPADFTVEASEEIDLAGIKLLVLHTPGHTPGGISLYSAEQGVVFSGDALFADSVGRTDFPGGSMKQLVAGIKEKLFSLPEQTKVCPGHGPETTIAREKKYNQYLH